MSGILGVIGGSGLYEMEGMRNVRQVVSARRSGRRPTP